MDKQKRKQLAPYAPPTQLICAFSKLPIEIIEILLQHFTHSCANSHKIIRLLAYTHPLMYVRIEHALYNLIRLKYNREFRCEPRIPIPKLIKMYTLTSIEIGYTFLPQNYNKDVLKCIFNKHDGYYRKHKGYYRQHKFSCVCAKCIRQLISPYEHMYIINLHSLCVATYYIHSDYYCFQVANYNYGTEQRIFWDFYIAVD